MARKKSVYVPPRICRGKRGEWFVEYSLRNPQTDRMYRKRHYEGFDKLKTIREKTVHAEKLVKAIKHKVEELGWRPWSDDRVIYEDNLEYSTVAQVFGRKKQGNNTIRMVTSKYVDTMKPPILAKKSYQSYLSKLRQFVMWMEKHNEKYVDVSAIRKEHIDDFYLYIIHDLKLARRTVLKYAQHLFALFDWMIQKEFIHESPYTRPPKMRNTVDHSARPFSQRDIKIMCQTMERFDPQLYLAAMFLYYAAVRPGNELKGLLIKDINFFNNRIHISQINGKMRARTIDMPDPLKELILKYEIDKFPHDYYVFGRNHMPGPERLSVNNFSYRFNKLRVQLGMPEDYKLYSFKHNGAGALLEFGATIEEIMKHLGHTDIQSTHVYIRRHFGERNPRIIKHFPPPYLLDKEPHSTE